VHDAAVWQMSNIKNYLRRNYENGDSSFLIGIFNLETVNHQFPVGTVHNKINVPG